MTYKQHNSAHCSTSAPQSYSRDWVNRARLLIILLSGICVLQSTLANAWAWFLTNTLQSWQVLLVTAILNKEDRPSSWNPPLGTVNMLQNSAIVSPRLFPLISYLPYKRRSQSLLLTRRFLCLVCISKHSPFDWSRISASLTLFSGYGISLFLADTYPLRVQDVSIPIEHAV